jgi:hypothetical protein
MKLPETLALLRRCVAPARGAHDADAELLLGTLEATTSPMFSGRTARRSSRPRGAPSVRGHHRRAVRGRAPRAAVVRCRSERLAR